MRVPCIVRWPGQIPAGAKCDEIVSTMDFLPTFARLAGAPLPQDRIIDGRDVWPLLSGQPDARSPHAAFYYYYTDQLQAVRSGRWKLHLPLDAKRTGLAGGTAPAQAELYDLDADIGETHNVVALHADVVQRLTALAEAARDDLGDGANAGQAPAPCRPGRQSRAASLLRLTTCGSAIGFSFSTELSNGPRGIQDSRSQCQPQSAANRKRRVKCSLERAFWRMS